MGRIGLLVPSSNTTVEPEFYRALPKDVTLHCARLRLQQIATDGFLHRAQLPPSTVSVASLAW